MRSGTHQARGRPAPAPPGDAPEHDFVPQGEEAVAMAKQGGELLATIDGLLAKRLGCKAKGRYNQAGIEPAI